MKRRRHLVFFTLLTFLAVLGFCACGRTKANSPADGMDSSARQTGGTAPKSTYYAEESWEESAPLAAPEPADYSASKTVSSDANTGTGITGDSDGPQLEEKLVYTGNLNIQSLEYDACVAGIREKIKNFQGIIQSETESDDDYHWYYDDHVNSSTRNLFLIIRIPSARFYEFLDSVGEAGKVISRSVNVENISQSYSDTKTQIEALEIEERRLLEMMEKADTIEDMIAVESRLTEVQSDLNFYKTNLRSMDTDVAWSTISLSIEEVKKYSPTVVEETFGERVREAFSDAWNTFVDFLQGLVILLIELLPFLLLILAITLLVLFILKKTAPRREARRLEKEAERMKKQADEMARRQEAIMRQYGPRPVPPYGPPAGAPLNTGAAQMPAPETDAAGTGPQAAGTPQAEILPDDTAKTETASGETAQDETAP